MRTERGKFDLPAQMKARQVTEAYLSVVSASELLQGVHRATDPTVRQRRSSVIEQALDDFIIVPIGVEIARQHAALTAMLQSAGTIIGENDLWIAATCLTKNLAIVTANEREFRRVPRLIVENWLVT